MSAAADYFDQTQQLLAKLRATQLPAVERAAEICANSISKGGLVFMFGAGHSRMMSEESSIGTSGASVLGTGTTPCWMARSDSSGVSFL